MVNCCLPERQDCSLAPLSVHAEPCSNLTRAPRRVSSPAAELKRQCRRRLVRSAWRRRRRLPRAGAAFPRPHPGLLHSCCPARLLNAIPMSNETEIKQNLPQTKSTRRWRGLALTQDTASGAVGAWLATVTLELLGAAEIAAGLRLSSASRGVLVCGCRCGRYASLHGRRFRGV